jgi:hypothetical protein
MYRRAGYATRSISAQRHGLISKYLKGMDMTGFDLERTFRFEGDARSNFLARVFGIFNEERAYLE